MKKISNIAFDGTKEQETQLRAALAKLKDVPGGLMPAMQQAQDIYGYLPKEVQIIIAEELGVPLSDLPDNVQEDVRAGMGFDDEVTLEKWLESVQS